MKLHNLLKTEVSGDTQLTMWAASAQRLSCFVRGINSSHVLRVGWTEVNQILGGHRRITGALKCVLSDQDVAPFRNYGASYATGVDNPNFQTAVFRSSAPEHLASHGLALHQYVDK